MRAFKSAVATAAAVALTLSACSTSGSDDKDVAEGDPIKIGVVTSLTGPAASGFSSTEQGIKARFAALNADGGVNGHKLEYVMLDDASTPQGAAAAVRKGIQQEKVFGLISVSTVFYGGYELAVKEGVPVVGAGLDGGPEWLDPKSKTLFDILGGIDYSKAATTLGKAAKQQGATKVASVGYIESPSAAQSAKAFLKSAEAAGLEAGPYQGVRYGSTDVGPVVLAIKNSGADGLYLPVIPNTAFAIIGGLKQAGVNLKFVVLGTGYGGEILKSKEATLAGDGALFSTSVVPNEVGAEASVNFAKALEEYADYDELPTFAQTAGYLNADAFAHGLEKAGDDPTPESFVTALRKEKWNAAGLFAEVDFSKVGGIGAAMGPGNCIYLPQLKDGKFVIVKGLVPVCGELIPGVTIKP